MDSVKAGLDLRFAHAKDGFARMAVQAAVIVALMVFAAIAGAGALGGSVTCTAGCAEGIGFAVAATALQFFDGPDAAFLSAGGTQ